MSTLMTRMFRTDPARPRVFCEGAALCDHGERCNRNCSSKRRRPRPQISDTAWLWLLIVADVAVLVATGWVLTKIVERLLA